MSEFNMSVQALGGEIVAAVVADQETEGCDISAGLFGLHLSDLIRHLVQERMGHLAQIESLKTELVVALKQSETQL